LLNLAGNRIVERNRVFLEFIITVDIDLSGEDLEGSLCGGSISFVSVSSLDDV
jgi:hypothetical protein